MPLSQFTFLLLLLSLPTAVRAQCTPPIVDLLWVLDGTLNVGSVNHDKMKDFVEKFVNKMTIGVRDSRVGMVQFTPTARPDFYPLMHLSKDRLIEAIKDVPYKPCTGSPTQCFALNNDTSTLNYVAQFGLSPLAGNRPQLPDVIVLMTTDSYSETEMKLDAEKYEYVSPLYVFAIRIGSANKKLSLNIPNAASIEELRAESFDDLDELIEPLCEKMDEVVSGANGGSGGTTATGGIFGFGWMIVILIIILFLILVLMLCCCLWRSNKEKDRMKVRMQEALDNKLKWAVTRDSRDNSVQVGSAKARLVMPNGVAPRAEPIEKMSLTEFDIDSEKLERGMMEQATKESQTDLRMAAAGINGKKFHLQQGVPQIKYPDDERDAHSDSEAMSVIMSRSRISTLSALPEDHPARGLPPFDLLLVVDNSGSIGMTNFKKVKEFLQTLLDHVDVAPGRSRVAVQVFNVEPELYFSFDKYYSSTAVRIAIQKMPYGGGGTFLGRALQFAAGILSQNQDAHPVAPKVKKSRKGKPAPPKRSRLQMLCVISDGFSEDNVEQSTRHLHDKLGVKVAGVGVRSFHKDRLKNVTQYEGSIFLLNEVEALTNWMFRQQTFWREVHGSNNLTVPQTY